ncbi:MAG: DEAD/DEAH box helicase [Desulfotomaculum sp.]|nr:DEAD/DEAH box helicase [Desulfotomaculum sp.]
MQGTYIGLDLETTGLDSRVDKIIEVGLVKLVDGVITDSYHSLVNPGLKLPVKVKRLTGINDQMLATAPEIATILPAVIDFMADYPLIGHQVDFDQEFLAAALLRAAVGRARANILYDTVDLARIVLPAATNHKLATLCQICALDLEAPHRALEDARRAVLLAMDLVKHLAGFEALLLADLTQLLAAANSPWHLVMEELKQNALQNAFKRKITTRTGLRAPPVVPFNHDASEPDDQELKPVAESEIIAIFSDQGLLSQSIDRYEQRLPQLTMAKAVNQTLNSGGYLMAEAGTGTGKSIAYLLPAVMWAKKNKQRVVISTHTINLQEQLCDKDVPLLQSLPGMAFKVALVKGRNHYLCLRRWYTARDPKELNAAKTIDKVPRTAAFHARILVWLTLTATGERSELNIHRQDFDLWSAICAESESCLGTRCSFFHRMCFVNRARRAAEQADIIIVNHSLVFSDIKAGNKVLPPYKVLVVDEAHHLENAATYHLGTSITRFDLIRWLGNVVKIITRLTKLPPAGDNKYWSERLVSVKKSLQQVQQAADVFWQRITDFVNTHVAVGTSNRRTVRIKPGFDLSGMQIEIENFVQRINVLSGQLQQITNDLDGQMLDEEGKLTKEIALIFEKGLSLAADIAYTCDCSNQAVVNWLDAETTASGSEAISIHAVPVEIGAMLHQQLYENKNSVILTSATLTVDKNFDYFMERSGLNLASSDQLKTLQVESPFKYEEQSLLFVLNDLPSPVGRLTEDYLQQLATALGELVVTTAGRTLVLFTAHAVLREVYQRLKPVLEAQDILLLGHAIDGGRTRLVEEFKSSARAVLLGSGSFWEGLDIPGPALSCVVLVKLPFWPPSIPVIEARHEALVEQNKDGFRHFSLPEAVIKFKQGFGRLIRNSYDCGVVVVLDRRVVEKQYGRQFLRSLPISTYMQGSKTKMLDTIKRWLNKSE